MRLFSACALWRLPWLAPCIPLKRIVPVFYRVCGIKAEKKMINAFGQGG